MLLIEEVLFVEIQSLGEWLSLGSQDPYPVPVSPRMMLNVEDQHISHCCWWILYLRDLHVGDHLLLDQWQIFVVRSRVFQGSMCALKLKGVRDGEGNKAKR